MTPKLACPFCYSTIKSRRELWFQCQGKATALHDACRPTVDEARRRLTGFSEPTLPPFRPGDEFTITTPRKGQCPVCGGESKVRVCPECHTRLPYEFGISASPLVAMIGAKGTGKTVYLTVLSEVLQSERIRTDFNVDVHPIGDGLDGFTSASQWVQQNVRRVYRDHQLFPATTQAIDGRKEPLVLEWRSEQARRFGPFGRRRLRTNYLSFYDTAGEDLSSQSNAHELHYLRAAHSLILLLDPFQLPKAQQRLGLPPSAITSKEPTRQVLARVTEALKHSDNWDGEKITIPVAVAFVKMDAFYDELGATHPLRNQPRMVGGYDEVAGRNTHEQVAALLDYWGGGDINNHLHINYRTYQYFFVSALGAQPDYDTATVSPGGVQPYRVEEPLLWLLRKGNVLPKVRR